MKHIEIIILALLILFLIILLHKFEKEYASKLRKEPELNTTPYYDSIYKP